jgi:predicted nucleic acid-binding protein
MPETLVLDASMAVAWCFEDETTPLTEAVFDNLTNGAQAVAPALWPYEVANSLAVAERRRRINLAGIGQFLERLAKFPISIDPGVASRAFGQVLSIAREHNLSVYDAAYLELALRSGLPLATLDRNLRVAAKVAGVKVLST